MDDTEAEIPITEDAARFLSAYEEQFGCLCGAYEKYAFIIVRWAFDHFAPPSSVGELAENELALHRMVYLLGQGVTNEPADYQQIFAESSPHPPGFNPYHVNYDHECIEESEENEEMMVPSNTHQDEHPFRGRN